MPYLDRLIYNESHYIPRVNIENDSRVFSLKRAAVFCYVSNICRVYDFEKQTFQLCIDIFDRYLFKRKHEALTQSDYEKMSVISLWIASKYQELTHLSMSHLHFITENEYTSSELLSLEREICQTINFRMNRGTITEFLALYNPDMVDKSAVKRQKRSIQVLGDLCLCSSELAQFPYRIIAAGIVYCFTKQRDKVCELFRACWPRIEPGVNMIIPFYEALNAPSGQCLTARTPNLYQQEYTLSWFLTNKLI